MTKTEGIIFDIKKYAIHDGPGIRTTVFLKGCPLNCWWCHNPESKKVGLETVLLKRSGNNSEVEKVLGMKVSVEEVMEQILKDVVFYDQSGGGVTFSGGEPMVQVEFLSALLQACKESGINTILDTCGYAYSEEFDRICGLVDLFLYDIKIIDDTEHLKYTGKSNKLILENLKMLSENGEKIEIRIPIVPGITDTEENLEAIVRFLAHLENIYKVCLLPYNKLGEDKLEKFNMVNKLGCLTTKTRDELLSIGKKFKSYGYEVKIGG